MKNILEERFRKSLLKFGKKSRLHRVLALPVLFVGMFFFHVFSYIRGNGKRLAMLAMTVFLFVVYSSFSFPIFIHAEETEQGGIDFSVGDESVSLAQEQELDMTGVLEEDELLGLSEYGEASSHGYDSAINYDAEEILQSVGETGEIGTDTRAEAGANVSFSKDDWRLILVNKQHSIPDDYEFKLGTITGYLQCDERIIDDLRAMLQAAKEDHINLTISSPYRTQERQENNFNDRIALYMRKGMSYMEAYQRTSRVITIPDNSEHQIGLALDILCDSYKEMNAGFADTEAGKWLAANSYKYGFILRYPEGKEYYTGIDYEPWHFRYVGVDAATVITEKGITLEEFWEDL